MHYALDYLDNDLCALLWTSTCALSAGLLPPWLLFGQAWQCLVNYLNKVLAAVLGLLSGQAWQCLAIYLDKVCAAVLGPLRGRAVPCSAWRSTWTSSFRSMTSSGTTSGIPLDEYRKDIPPGWAPGDSRYTLKQYMERVKVWYRLFDGPDENVGPLLAGRLRGRAQQIALSLRLPDPTGHVDVGDAALVRLSVDEVTDPAGNIIQRAIPSGPQALLHALCAAFGEAEQLQATKALETFF